jgi:heme-degrading monooxygenase HmoA
MKLKQTFLILVAVAALSAADTKELIVQWRAQLQAARKTGTEEAYLQVEHTLDAAVKQDAADPLALLYRGAVKMERAGWLAQKGTFGPAQEVLAAACSDLDGAVAKAPSNLQVRLMRGLMYGRFPSFYNKGPLAKDDLETALKSPSFASESAEKRAETHLVLGVVYSSSGNIAQAGVEFLAAVDANPDGDSAKAARGQMKKLAETAPAANAQAAPYHPDRFPKVSADLSPVIAVASITITKKGAGDDSYMQDLVKMVKSQPGLLGTHVLQSMDRPGMLVIMTWWKDKQALNDWFYSDGHQGLIRRLYVDRKSSGGDASQVAIELLAPLEGGMRFGGGLAPELAPEVK